MTLEVQSQYQALPLKRLVKLVTQKAEQADHRRPYIGLEHIESGTGKIRSGHEPEPTDAETSNVFGAGDVLFGKLRPYLAKAYLADFDGRCTSEALVLRPTSSLMSGEFLRHLVLSPPFLSLVDSSTYGAKMPRASWDFVGEIKVPAPPLSSQQIIADFLDRMTEAIDGLIAKKERLMELLQEKRQALITQAVTKGLDPSVPMKDSGIEWLGQIPAHWEVTRLGHVCQSIQTGPFGSQVHVSDYVEDGVPLINPSHLRDGKLAPDRQISVTHDTAARLSLHALRAGDIVFARRGELGRCGLVDTADLPALCGTGSARVRLAEARIIPSYGLRIFRGGATAEYFARQSVGATMANLNESILSRLPFALPSIAEQVEVLAVLKDQERKFTYLLGQLMKQLGLLREYRQALITAAVTGQLDVAENLAAEAEAVA